MAASAANVRSRAVPTTSRPVAFGALSVRFPRDSSASVDAVHLARRARPPLGQHEEEVERHQAAQHFSTKQRAETHDSEPNAC
jgi:hypothetical protein